MSVPRPMHPLSSDKGEVLASEYFRWSAIKSKVYDMLGENDAFVEHPVMVLFERGDEWVGIGSDAVNLGRLFDHHDCIDIELQMTGEDDHTYIVNGVVSYFHKVLIPEVQRHCLTNRVGFCTVKATGELEAYAYGTAEAVAKLGLTV